MPFGVAGLRLNTTKNGVCSQSSVPEQCSTWCKTSEALQLLILQSDLLGVRLRQMS
jgi:hypothetical protein